ACTVIGVASQGFKGTDIGASTEIWVPMMMQTHVMPGADFLNTRSVSWLYLLGRLKPGVSLQEAQSAMTALDRQFQKAYPNPDPQELVLAPGRQADAPLPVDLP